MRRIVMGIGVLAVLLVVGLIVGGSRGGDVIPSVDTSQPAERTTARGKAETIEVVPSPEEAAVAAVAMTGEVTRAGFISRRELIESFTTPAFGPVLAGETSAQMNSLLLEFSQREADPAGMQVVEQPLRVRVTAASATTATVEVWSVVVVALPGAPTARVMWRTVTLDMELVDGAWLVDGWTSSPGPAPMAGSESPISPASDVADVLGWTAVPAEVS
jgi:hypothetical protein